MGNQSLLKLVFFAPLALAAGLFFLLRRLWFILRVGVIRKPNKLASWSSFAMGIPYALEGERVEVYDPGGAGS